MDGTTLDAELFRRAIGTLISPAGGIIAPGDLAVAQQSVPNMSIQVGVGQAWVMGTSTPSQGGYYAKNGAAATLAINASSPSNPRIDQVILQVIDKAYAGASTVIQLIVVPGTPTPGANVTPGSGGYHSGIGAVPASSLVLAYVLVPTSAVSIVTADIENVASVARTGMPALAYRSAGVSLTAGLGDFIVAAPGVTITLPSPSANPNAMVAIEANASVTGASPVTVAGTNIQGVGLASASSFLLGTPGACAVLQSDGTNWRIVSGQQDTGWVALTLGTSIAGATSIGAITVEAPAGRLIGNRVSLKGVAQNNTGGNIGIGYTVATAPAVLRPSVARSIFTADVNAGWTASADVGGRVLSTGVIGATSAADGNFLLFDNASYSL